MFVIIIRTFKNLQKEFDSGSKDASNFFFIFFIQVPIKAVEFTVFFCSTNIYQLYNYQNNFVNIYQRINFALATCANGCVLVREKKRTHKELLVR